MPTHKRSACRPGVVALALTAGAVAAVVAVRSGQAQGGGGREPIIPTTPDDFFQPGTQPDPVGLDPFIHSTNCSTCHGFYLEGEDYEPYESWVASMMAQSARDPVWHAAVALANQDAAFSGEACIRCHAPTGWLNGRSSSGRIEDLIPADFDGVSCHFCHRMVDPVYDPKTSPPQDAAIHKTLEFPFAQPGGGRFVIDPVNVRRGPFDDVPINMHGPAAIIYSSFHRKSELCASCHDVSIPTVTRQPDGSYAPNALGEPHPTQNPHDMFPEQRTYSEWLHSTFAKGGVAFADGRFGGNHPTGVMESCQDCHMPDEFAGGCFAWDSEPFFPRPDMPRHIFNGANTWVLGAVLAADGAYESGLTPESVQTAQERTVEFLRAASDLVVRQVGTDLSATVVNYTGHKLPTGYPEGRRMWINVRYLDGDGDLVLEHGRYDAVTATLDASSTKVYAATHGLDETMAALTGLPEGPSSHLALNNKIWWDNRIPPMGFTNKAYEAVGAAPVGHFYADGQHWDETVFAIPPCATQAVVTVYYQTSSREYMEFLRDATDDPAGEIAYAHWVEQGMSAPVDMDSILVKLAPVSSGDTNRDGIVNVPDIMNVILGWGVCRTNRPCPGDTNCDGYVDVRDLINVIMAWSR